jgi:hypothetical protein
MLTMPRPDTPGALQKKIQGTYFALRMGIVALSFALPAILYGYSWIAEGGLKEHSMSAFYGAHGGVLRNWFVGILWAVGSFLILYKGFSALEEWLLNFAGGFAILTAMTPCRCWIGQPDDGHSALHAFFAVSFFACMALVCELCARDTISLLPDEPTRTAYRHRYHAIGVSLAASPAAALAVSFVLRSLVDYEFFIEWFGVAVFAAYWAVKSREFHITAAEKRALRGELKYQEGVGLRPAGEA